MQTIEQRLAALRAKMREAGYAGYYIPTDDFHLSEYVGAHFKARAYMSGFTGSAGTLVVLEHEAALWVDGRYFLQGEQQLCGTPITLQKSGEEGVPTILEYLKEKLPEGGVLGMDGRTVPAATGLSFKKELAQRKVTLAPERDLVGEVWADRPPLSAREALSVEVQIKYEGYINRELAEVARQERLESKVLPNDLDYTKITGLRIEAVQKLNTQKPMTVGQASRISGVSPADISVLLIYLERNGINGDK